MELRKVLIGLLTVILIGVLVSGCSGGVTEDNFDALESRVDTIQTGDLAEIQNIAAIRELAINYAWAMDELDQEAWASVFSPNIESYTVRDIDGNPRFMIPVPDPGEWQGDVPADEADPTYGAYMKWAQANMLYMMIGGLETPYDQLMAMGGTMVFDRVVNAQSVISNVAVELTGAATATARDYFRHWEIVNPEHSANKNVGRDGDHWYFESGKHEYELAKEDGEWKITKFTGTTLWSEAREIQ